MEIIGKAQKVTIYIGESDRWEHQPLYTAILELLRRENCAGATVTRALAGFGAASRIHTASIVALSSDLPLIIEWVDNPVRVERVMPHLRVMVTEGLITVQDVEVVTYSHRRLREFPAAAPVHDVMSHEVLAVHPETPLAEAVELLLDKVYRTLPVVDERRRVVGIVTDGDLLKRGNLLAITAQKELTQAEVAQALAEIRQSGQQVATVMTPNPATVTPETTLADAVHLMATRDVKRLPVVDEQGHLLGMLSRVNVLRALAEPPVAETKRQALPPGQHTRVGEIMMTRVPTVAADASLEEVIESLVTHARRRVVVIDNDRHVLGIITDGDLIKRATQTERPGIVQSLLRRTSLEQADRFRLQKRTAADVMSSPAITVTPDTSLLDALQLLLRHHVKRLPVVDEQDYLVGLVGRGGILQALSHNQKNLGD